MSVLRVLLAGLGGTCAEALLTRLERRLLGPSPIEPPALARRLAARNGIELSATQAEAAGAAMRWTYGPCWGAVAAGAGARLAWPAAAGLVGAGLFGFELLALPLSGAAPPIRAWGTRFVAADALNTLVYGAVATWLASRLFTDSGRAR